MQTLSIDRKLNKWAYDINIPNKEAYLNNLLNIGYRLSTLITLDTTDSHIEQLLNLQQEKNENCMNMTIQNLEQTMNTVGSKMELIEKRASENSLVFQDKLIQMVEEFIGKTKTSVSRGDIAENYIEDICELHFPNDDIIRSSGKAHEADLQLKSNDFPTIMIESKNYTNTIQTKEIDKLKYDMSRTEICYAVFFSFNSKISGKKNMDIEHFDNKCILYVSNVGFNEDIVVMAINTLKMISKISNSCKNYINKAIVKDKVGLIINNLNKLPDLISNLSKAKTVLQEEEKTIHRSLDNIHIAYISAESQMKKIIQDIEIDINCQLQELNEIEYVHVEKIENLLNYIEDKKKDHVRDVVTQIFSKNYKISISEQNNQIFEIYNPLRDTLISKLDTRSTKLKLSIIENSCIFEIGKKNIISCLKSYFKILENM